MNVDFGMLGALGAVASACVGATWLLTRSMNADIVRAGAEQSTAIAALGQTVAVLSTSVTALSATFNERTAHIQTDVTGLRLQISESEGRVREALDRTDKDLRELRDVTVKLSASANTHASQLARLEGRSTESWAQPTPLRPPAEGGGIR